MQRLLVHNLPRRFAKSWPSTVTDSRRKVDKSLLFGLTSKDDPALFRQRSLQSPIRPRIFDHMNFPIFRQTVVAAAFGLAGSTAILSAGSAQAAVQVVECTFVNFSGCAVALGDKTFSNFLTDYSPAQTADKISIEWNDGGSPLTPAGDFWTILLDFTPNAQITSTKFLSYDVAITDPDWVFSTAEADSTVTLLGGTTTAKFAFTGLIPASPGPTLTSTNGSKVATTAVNDATKINVNTSFVSTVPAQYDSISLTFDQRPKSTTVPGPLPLLGAGAAFAYSRKLRSRIKVQAA